MVMKYEHWLCEEHNKPCKFKDVIFCNTNLKIPTSLKLSKCFESHLSPWKKEIIIWLPNIIASL
jgi:hypothetical protein